jgi:hypothetical protein
MNIVNPFSEPGTLLLVGVALLVASILLRRVLKSVLKGEVRTFDRGAKVDLRAHESLLK